jgi:hypothetical protein
MAENKPQLVLARPADKSLEAFKAFITKMTEKLSPGAKSTITEEKWIQLHKDFWSDDEETTPKDKPA